MPKKDKVLNLLLRNVNKEVSAWDIAMKCKTLHHTELIRQLRKDYKIENRTLWVSKNWEKMLYSWYKLVIPEVKPNNWLQRILFTKIW